VAGVVIEAAAGAVGAAAGGIWVVVIEATAGAVGAAGMAAMVPGGAS
jgi:hypothetical protein